MLLFIFGNKKVTLYVLKIILDAGNTQLLFTLSGWYGINSPCVNFQCLILPQFCVTPNKLGKNIQQSYILR